MLTVQQQVITMDLAQMLTLNLMNAIKQLIVLWYICHSLYGVMKMLTANGMVTYLHQKEVKEILI